MRPFLVWCFVPSFLLALADVARAGVPAPLAVWPFDGDLADAGGNGVVLMNPYKKLDYGPGVAGQAIRFTWEKRDYLRTQKPEQLPMEGDFTVSAWFNAVEGPQRNSIQGLVGRWDYNGKAQFALALAGSSAVAYLSTDGSKLHELKHPSAVDFETWYHVALVHRADARNVTLYLTAKEGKSLDSGVSKTFDAPIHSELKTPFTIGFNQYGGRFLNGALDEVAVWDRALSPQELGEVFSRGCKGQPLLGGKP
ncbi:MAG: LamG domain-containing protein [Verrucomicrobiae bacterium]|nr:LamG domain-containing protein [Verrucomicrobiae bacterium]